MIIEIPYGKDSHQTLTIPDANFIGTLRPNELLHSDEQRELERAFSSPISTERIEDFLKGGKDIVFIVNDGTRPTPTAAILRVLSKKIDLSSVRFLIATGIHRAPTEEEYRMIFGSFMSRSTTASIPMTRAGTRWCSWVVPRTGPRWRSTRSR